MPEVKKRSGEMLDSIALIEIRQLTLHAANKSKYNPSIPEPYQEGILSTELGMSSEHSWCDAKPNKTKIRA